MSSKPVVGAQLYTLREHCKTMPDIVETLRKVREIGYSTVQISGFGPVDPKDVAQAVSDAGLTVAATHMGWNDFLNDLDRVIETHRLWNCRHAAIGGLPGDYFSIEGIDRFVSELGPVAARLAEAGMDFSYHNHNHELARFGDKTWLATLYEKADPSILKAEIDTYWIQAGGADPASWVSCCSGRIPLLHVKDMCIVDHEQRFAEIGQGNLNWPAILKQAEAAGTKYLLVEQDHCYGRDPFECLAVSYRNLKAMGYE